MRFGTWRHLAVVEAEPAARPEEVAVTVMAPGSGFATVEKIAINAVMAGASPVQFPIILAAMEAIVSQPWQNQTWVVNRDGSNKRLLCSGQAACPVFVDGIQWVYFQKRVKGPLFRLNVDNPAVEQLVYDKHEVGGGESGSMSANNISGDT